MSQPSPPRPGACRPKSGKRDAGGTAPRNSPTAARAVLALVHNVGGAGIEAVPAPFWES